MCAAGKEDLMQSFTYYMPTKVICGRDCVQAQGEQLKALGASALILIAGILIAAFYKKR